MANWKHYINAGFAGCTLIAYTRDECRNRDVRLYLIPGQDECLGVTDGTDAWIAPIVADIFRVNARRLVDDIRAGKGIPKLVPPRPAGHRRALLLDESDAPPPRRPRARLESLPSDPPPQRNRRALLT